MITYIYKLSDPRDGQVKYIGKTRSWHLRHKSHRTTPRGNDRCANWKRHLRALGLFPVMEIIEEIHDDSWPIREQYWIAYYEAFGADLTNLTNGGEGGTPCGRRLSNATKERLRQRFKGRPIPPEQRAQISKALTGRRQTKETVEKRIATINANRVACGLPPRERHASKSAKVVAYKRRRRRREGQAIRYTPEWRAKIAAGLNNYHAKRKQESIA